MGFLRNFNLTLEQQLHCYYSNNATFTFKQEFMSSEQSSPESHGSSFTDHNLPLTMLILLKYHLLQPPHRQVSITTNISLIAPSISTPQNWITLHDSRPGS